MLQSMTLGVQEMAHISSEDIESVRAGMMTLSPLSKETDFLWSVLLDVSLNRRKGISAHEILQLRSHANDQAAILPSFVESLRKVSEELNKRLEPLLGYGYKVKVIRSKTFYSLEILKGRPRPASELWLDHNFKWKGEGLEARNLQVWVPIHENGEEIDIKYRSQDKSWSAPAGFGGYKDFRDKLWPPFAERHQKGPNSQGWCVERFLPIPGKHGRRAIELTLSPVAFADIVGTTLHLTKPLLPGPGADNGENTIQEWLQKHPAKDGGVVHAGGLTHFMPAANPLTVDVNVVTQDDYFVFRWYEKNKTRQYDAVRRWEPGIFGYVDSLEDVYRNALHVPDPSETVFRRSCQLLGIPILPARVCWLGVGFGLDFGRVSLFGEIRLNHTAAELNTLCKNRVKTVQATPKSVYNELELGAGRATSHRPHFEVLLALSLARLNRKNIKIQTSTRPSTKLLDEIKQLKAL